MDSGQDVVLIQPITTVPVCQERKPTGCTIFHLLYYQIKWSSLVITQYTVANFEPHCMFSLQYKGSIKSEKYGVLFSSATDRLQCDVSCDLCAVNIRLPLGHSRQFTPNYHIAEGAGIRGTSQ